MAQTVFSQAGPYLEIEPNVSNRGNLGNVFHPREINFHVIFNEAKLSFFISHKSTISTCIKKFEHELSLSLYI